MHTDIAATSTLALAGHLVAGHLVVGPLIAGLLGAAFVAFVWQSPSRRNNHLVVDGRPRGLTGSFRTSWWLNVDAAGRETRMDAAGTKNGMPNLDSGLLLVLIAAALTSGAPLIRALEVVGHAVGGSNGDSLLHAAQRLQAGSAWEQAWNQTTLKPLNSSGSGLRRSRLPQRPLNDLVEPLHGFWVSGASATQSLELAAERIFVGRATQVTLASGKLAARLTLPLGLCFLPSFVLLGLYPVAASLLENVVF